MGQKKRSVSARPVTPSNGALPVNVPKTHEVTISPPLNDVEGGSNDSEYFCTENESLSMTGELRLAQENLESFKAAAGLDASKATPEDVFSVRSECEKALVALRRGNSTKALKLIRDACSRHEYNALVQRVHGHISMRLASMIEDPTTKQRHLKEAIEAAHRAVILSPRSVEYSQFHAQLLFEVATDSKGFEEVVQECKRALEIECPIDPAKESLHEEGQHKLPSAEARIAQVQQELQTLIQKANIASLSNWMKVLGNGGSEEKVRFIPMRKLVDDPMEQRVSQPKRPHEVKKSVKTPEEKRKDIEVRVAAARLLQQKRDCSPPRLDDGSAKPMKAATRLERRKSGGLNSRKGHPGQNPEEQVERLKPFWNSLGSMEKERMLEVNVHSLKEQYHTPKASLTRELLCEALEFAQEKKTWRYWVCCECEKRFIDCHEHAEHVMHEHKRTLSPKLRRLLPHEIDQDLADQIMSEDCQPYDGPSAIKLLIDSCQLGTNEETIPGHLCSTGDNNGFHRSVESDVPSKDAIMDILSDYSDRVTEDSSDTIASREPTFRLKNEGKEVQALIKGCDEKCQQSKKVLQVGRDFKRHELPLADEDERAKMLQKTFNLFGILIKNKCLASDHMEKIVQYCLDELQSFIPDTSVQYEFNHSPIYLRFLPAPQLRRISNYLRELVNACGLDHPSDSAPSSLSCNEEEDVILDRHFLNGDFASLTFVERPCKQISTDEFLEQRLSSQELDPYSVSLNVTKNGEAVLQTDEQLSWVYQKADYEFQPVSWRQFREARMQQCRDILVALDEEFVSLKECCDEKGKHLQYEEVVIMLETLCIEELKKREMKVDGSQLCHEAVLHKYQQELLKNQQELLENQSNGLSSQQELESSQQKLELKVISSILRDAQTINLPQFAYDGAVSVTSSKLSDLDDEEEDSWRVSDLVSQLDPCIEVAIQRQKERRTSEVNKLDARILRSMDIVQRLELKLGSVSVLDYRAVVIPLVKSFLKLQLEDAAEKDALMKSDAARDAFLAELSRNEKRMNERCPDYGRHSKEKAKDKKKNKEHRKLKDGKRYLNPSTTPIQKATETRVLGEILNGVDEDQEDKEEMVVEESEKFLLEAELRRQAEVEEEERKLAETLELQRRVEEEAKERHFAELKKKQSEVEGPKPIQLGGQIHDSNTDAVQETPASPYGHDLSPKHSSDANGSLVQQFEQTLDLDPLVTDIVHYHSCESNSPTEKGFCKVSVHDSFGMPFEESREECLVVSSEQEYADSVCSKVLNSDTAINLSNRHTILQDCDTEDASFSRPRRGGKSKKKKASRSMQDENSLRNASQNHTIGVGDQVFEQVKRSSLSNDRLQCSCPETRVKSAEAGVTWKKKQIYTENGVQSKNLAGHTHSSNKTLRELKAEQDDEDRFLAELEQAMQQSLAIDTAVSHGASHPESVRSDCPMLLVTGGSMPEEVGKGLQNEIGQYNCFLNVVIQSLWHLRRFREDVLAISSVDHMHVGDPCVVCALRDIFVGLNSPVSDMMKDTIAPTTLRIALSNLYSQKDFFQEAQMNDASEVLAVLFDCLHKAFKVTSGPSDGDSNTSGGIGHWECQDHTPCIAHSLFALDIAMQMNCTRCELESRHLKYTSFFHNINANALRTARILYQESSLDELLRLVEMNQFLGCDKEVGGCGQQNYIHYLLRSAPHVFIIVLGWQNSRESLEDISATMDAIGVDMDIGVVYRGLDKGFKHRLVSVICYYGQHYHCFAFNLDIGRWVMFDDTTVKIIGRYEDVLDTCRRGHLQPQVLFYEAFSINQ